MENQWPAWQLQHLLNRSLQSMQSDNMCSETEDRIQHPDKPRKNMKQKEKEKHKWPWVDSIKQKDDQTFAGVFLEEN